MDVGLPKSKKSHRTVPVPPHVPTFQALLGHEDYATPQKYAHMAPDAHNKVIDSWSRRVPADARFPALDAPVTHETAKARPR
jgi:hypothetical protein